MELAGSRVKNPEVKLSPMRNEMAGAVKISLRSAVPSRRVRGATAVKGEVAGCLSQGVKKFALTLHYVSHTFMKSFMLLNIWN